MSFFRTYQKNRVCGVIVSSLLVVSMITSAFFALVMSSVPSNAGVISDLTGQGSGFASVLYDGSNGLPTSEANAIVQSADGFIWIGGYSGLIRYDGNEFYRYPSSTGISSVKSLFVDSKDNLWIGTNDNGIAVLEGDSFRFFTREDGLTSSTIQSICEDREGDIIIATTMGMAYITGEELHLINDPQINKQYICELYLGNDGIVYSVTNDGSFFTVDSKRVSGYYNGEDLGMGAVNTIYPDPDNKGYVYIGTQNSEIIYGRLGASVKDCTVLSTESQVNINSIRKINGNIWITSDNGIGYFDSSLKYTVITDIPMNNSIDHLMYDYEGNMWFTSSRQGVMKIVENRFTDISKLASLPSAVVNSTCISGDNLYIATDKGLFVLDKNYNTVENSATALLAGARIRCIKKDGDGKLWFCSYAAEGLVCYDPSSDSYINFNADNGLLSSRVRMITFLENGDIAVATNKGMNIISDGAVSASYAGAQGISNLEILCIEQANDGTIYLGSDGDGIYKITGTRVSRIGIPDGLTSEVILRLKKDPASDIIWVITSSSIGYLKDDKVTTIRNFPYSNNFDIFFDKYDRLWVLASNGIYVVKKSDMLTDTSKIEYTFFDTKCGLPSTATANSYSYVDSDGTLYISASTGVSSINIDGDTESGRDIRLSVPFLTADDGYIRVTDGRAEIPSTCRRLTIYANAFTFSLNNPRLRYQLEGFDEEWIELNKQDLDRISYTNLKGGTYTFRFSIINSLTGSADKMVTVTIVKAKAFYEHTAFWIILAVAVLLLAVGIVVLIYHGKTKRLLEKQRETKEFINEMTAVFADCVDMKDPYTKGHSTRVAKYTAWLAEKLGKTKDETDELYNIALLHDIGKISIPDSILNKPSRLDDEEYKIMKSHSERGGEILKAVTIDPQLSLGAGAHHERYDGKGYPKGLAGEEIPEAARIIAVADTFDAMYSTRPYRKKMDLSVVVAEIEKGSGTQFSPVVVEAFRKLYEEGAFDNE